MTTLAGYARPVSPQITVNLPDAPLTRVDALAIASIASIASIAEEPWDPWW
ncbi:hypothetical protein BN381_130388 [Candidatus Microthrix parvicella RN1]|jgi:hypothetical protein|uniref:Uncharacterized protein n=1 Tax=Candidatus Neomicrothrix parvicella RN1 TaxID=1229780 RepID=R4YXF5_9ACTN|nr:hypothetical protein BN381_130388 [Candidatus Microthrix parvicella RN1]